MLIEKTKADDKIFLAIGVDFRDTLPNIFKLGLESDPEIKAVLAGTQKKFQAHIEMRQAEREAQEKDKVEDKEAVEQKKEES